MAYVKGSLSKVYDELESGIAFWLYFTADTLPTILGSGYISDATDKRLKIGDIVDVFTGTLTDFTAATGGATLGGVTFGPTVGVKSRFASQPTYLRCAVSAVGTPTSTTPGAATLALVDVPMLSLLSNPRNLLDGGDATINPWQRGTSITGIVATNTYTADRWFMVAGSSSSATMVQTANTSVPGFSQAFVWGRGQSSGIASSIVVGQALESLDSIRAQGQAVSFSFWAAANTGYNTSSLLGVTVTQGFGTDQSASALVNGTWTSQTNVVSATQALTATMTRYSFSGTVSNTATQLGVLLSYTPSNTTALAAENVIMNGLQLEIGGVTPFEHREIEQELAYCQRYYFQVNEPGTSGTVVAAGMVAGTNTCLFVLQLPVQMRAAPTVTVTQGSFGANIIGAYTALTSLAAGSTHTVNYVSILGNATAVSGQSVLMISSSAATGKLKVSADL